MSYLYIAIVSIFYLTSNTSLAYIEDIETVRLKSTAGVGVGSVLLNEATILNPASIVFHKRNSAYYSKEQKNINIENAGQLSSNNFRELYIITDNTSTLKGGFSYEYSNIYSHNRKRITSSSAASINKSTSVGAILKYTEDEFINSHKTSIDFDLGVHHVYSEKLSFGFVVKNVSKASSSLREAILGLQYNIFGNLDFILDVGSKLFEEETETFEGAAVQLRVFESFFLRSGRFQSRIKNQKGSAWGASWVGPKLSIEYAYKTYEPIDSQENSSFFGSVSGDESSLSLVLIF